MLHNDLILYSFYYTLSCKGCVVEDMINYLKEHWEEILPVYRKIIVKDLCRVVKNNTTGVEVDKRWKYFFEYSVLKQ